MKGPRKLILIACALSTIFTSLLVFGSLFTSPYMWLGAVPSLIYTLYLYYDGYRDWTI